MNDSGFCAKETTLEDGSKVCDVFHNDGYDQTLVANAPSDYTAQNMAYSLNALVDRFMGCGSDREVSSFARAFDKFMADHSKASA